MEIVTERLTLREHAEDDWPAIHAYQSDPLSMRYYAWEERTPEAVQESIKRFAAFERERPRVKFQLVVVLTASGELIGNCGIRMDTPDAHEADIGYEIAPRHWGNGYATEAARAMLDFGFITLNLHRIWAWCVADNAASTRVLEKLDMRPEGRLRDKDHYKGRYWDRLHFAILDHEWRAHQAR
jgi:[ribosomal protein S5]-alanine N-acetyltransferase